MIVVDRVRNALLCFATNKNPNTQHWCDKDKREKVAHKQGVEWHQTVFVRPTIYVYMILVD